MTPMCLPLEILPARQVSCIQATDSTQLAPLLRQYWISDLDQKQMTLSNDVKHGKP